MKFYFTPRSHFSRKVRLLLGAYNTANVPIYVLATPPTSTLASASASPSTSKSSRRYKSPSSSAIPDTPPSSSIHAGHIDFIDIGNVGKSEANGFGPNPMMKVPTLVDCDGTEVIDSDHIASYLVRNVFLDSAEDKFEVLTTKTQVLNARAILNTIMSNEVELVLARRAGMDTTKYPRFNKHILAINQGLTWLDERMLSIFKEEQPTYINFHLLSAYDHLKLYDIVPVSEEIYPNLSRIVESMQAFPYVKETYPPK
jgi:glutathione S-transferase